MNSSDTPYSNKKLSEDTITPDKDRRMRAMLFTCKPGNNPVAIPVTTPKIQNKIMRKKSNKTIPLQIRK